MPSIPNWNACLNETITKEGTKYRVRASTHMVTACINITLFLVMVQTLPGTGLLLSLSLIMMNSHENNDTSSFSVESQSSEMTAARAVPWVWPMPTLPLLEIRLNQAVTLTSPDGERLSQMRMQDSGET